MTPLTEQNSFDAQVESYDTTDPVQGGPGGVANTPLQSLANRSRWLYNQIVQIVLELPTLAPLNSPSLTGTPTGPTPPAGDNSNKLATTAFVQQASGAHAAVSLSGASTYTVPANVYAIFVERWGGGGGSGGAQPNTTGTGGGGGAYGADWLGVQPGQQIGYSVGAGGSAGTPTADGGYGAPTTFGALAAVGGGAGGGSARTAAGSGSPAPAGAAIGFPGGDGGGGFAPSLNIGGPGGNSPRGGQGGVQANGDPGNPGKGPGAGGGGAGSTTTQANGGAAGQPGLIVVSY